MKYTGGTEIRITLRNDKNRVKIRDLTYVNNNFLFEGVILFRYVLNSRYYKRQLSYLVA